MEIQSVEGSLPMTNLAKLCAIVLVGFSCGAKATPGALENPIDLDENRPGFAVRIQHPSGNTLNPARAYDRNGDGYEDLLITRSGFVYEIAGGTNLPGSITLGAGYGGSFSGAVFGANWFKADNFPEIFGWGPANCGTFVIFGPNGIESYPQISQATNTPGTWFCGGGLIGGIGDVSGDGIEDIAFGIQSALAIAFGIDRWSGGGGFSVSPLLNQGASSGGAFKPFGPQNAPIGGGDALGDLDGNGSDEIVVTTPATKWIFWGPFPLGQQYFYPDNFNGGQFTQIINTPPIGGTAGFGSGRGQFDFNGDNTEDAVFDMSGTSLSGVEQGGKLCVVFGENGQRPAILDLGTLAVDDGFCVIGDVPLKFLGQSVQPLGDLNGDGFDDIVSRLGGNAALVVFGRPLGGVRLLSELTIDEARAIVGGGINSLPGRLDTFSGDSLADFYLQGATSVFVILGSESYFGQDELLKDGFEEAIP